MCGGRLGSLPRLITIEISEPEITPTPWSLSPTNRAQTLGVEGTPSGSIPIRPMEKIESGGTLKRVLRVEQPRLGTLPRLARRIGIVDGTFSNSVTPLETSSSDEEGGLTPGYTPSLPLETAGGGPRLRETISLQTAPLVLGKRRIDEGEMARITALPIEYIIDTTVSHIGDISETDPSLGSDTLPPITARSQHTVTIVVHEPDA